MPTAKPRVQVTLSQPAYDTITRVAKARGVSRSEVLAELAEAARPALDRVAELIEVSKAAPKEVLQRFASAVAGSESQAENMFASSLGQLDLLIHGIRDGRPWDQFDEAAADNRAQRDVAASALRNPRPVTRGSGMKVAPGQRYAKRPSSPSKPLKKRGKSR